MMATDCSTRAADVIAGLLRQEQAGIGHFIGEASPYIRPSDLAIGRLVRRIGEADRQRETELVEQVYRLGGELLLPPVCPERQYMAFQSIRYLLPGLISAREQSIARYEQAAAQLQSHPDLVGLLRKHVAQMRDELAELRRAAA